MSARNRKQPPPQIGVILPDGMAPGTPEADAYVKKELAKKSTGRTAVSEKRARATRRQQANSKAAAPAPTEPTPEPLKYPGCVVFRIPVEGEPGKETINIQELNGLDPLAVPTLLKAAAGIKENQLGVGGRNG